MNEILCCQDVSLWGCHCVGENPPPLSKESWLCPCPCDLCRCCVLCTNFRVREGLPPRSDTVTTPGDAEHLELLECERRHLRNSSARPLHLASVEAEIASLRASLGNDEDWEEQRRAAVEAEIAWLEEKLGFKLSHDEDWEEQCNAN